MDLKDVTGIQRKSEEIEVNQRKSKENFVGIPKEIK